MRINQSEVVLTRISADELIIDSGSTSNLICPKLSVKIEKTISATAKRFDGTETESKIVQLVQPTLEMDGQIFDSELMLEWELLGTHVVLLGNPWLASYNPAIDWRTQHVTFTDTGVPRGGMKTSSDES
ncbi:putative aspartic peptidase domain superfamily [Plasmopara halstedii]